MSDPINGTYSKLVLSDDASTLLGGILVGDASSYVLLRPLVGQSPPGDPVSLNRPGHRRRPSRSARAGDDAQICSCNDVPRHAVLGDRERCPTAGQGLHRPGTSCGSCVPLLAGARRRQAWSRQHGAVRALRPSRAELFELVQASGIRTFTGLIARFGTGTGCDICKPTVASILASTSSDHILSGEQASLQDSNDHFPGQHPTQRHLLGGAARARR